MQLLRHRLHRFTTLAALAAVAACSSSAEDPAVVAQNGPTTVTAELKRDVTKSGEGQFLYRAGDEAERAAGGLDTPKLIPPDDGRKVIRTGQITIVVPTYNDARTKIDALLKELGGYIDSTNVNHRQGEVSDATIVIRIPADGMGSILPKLRAIGEIVSETTNAADITDQYVDVAARLASAQALEKRLLELAANRNGKVEDVLAVERELARVRGEIEGYEGHIRQWNDHVAMSTLTLQISTKRPEIVAATPPTLGEKIDDGFHGSIAKLRDTGSWLVVHAIAFLPWLLFAIPGLVLARRLSRRVKLPWAIARKATPPAEPPKPE